MDYDPANPLVVQGDRTILLEVNNPLYEEARDELSRFAELEKSPEYIHTYRLSQLSLWNAASSGITAGHIIGVLERYGKFPLPQNIGQEIADQIGRYGRVKLIRQQDRLLLVSDDPCLIAEIANHKKVRPYLQEQENPCCLAVLPGMRGHLKHTLIKLGFPVEDLAGYSPGAPFSMRLQAVTGDGRRLSLRDYQCQAADAFYAGGSERGGSGVIVLPCGAGKTLVGIALMEQIASETLILTTNITALRQWKQELLDKTDISEERIGEYSGEVKEIRPVTIATYQILTYRPTRDESFPHLKLFSEKDWGFIIYDEVHLLPAPVFRVTAEIQAKRRLGLTATLVREDGLEEDVFSLIGPKKYDVPWKSLEHQGWIACATCVEVRAPLPESDRMQYALANSRAKFRIASENRQKLPVVAALLNRHQSDSVLIIGQYLDQLQEIADQFGAPLITGKTPNLERMHLYDAFKRGALKVLVVSKVANFAIDLPDTSVAIQVSGTFGSRQEEAQRLGRILRPKAGANMAYFYSLVTADSREQEFAVNRQLFLTEQGYRYYIKTSKELYSPDSLPGHRQSAPVTGECLQPASKAATLACNRSGTAKGVR